MARRSVIAAALAATLAPALARGGEVTAASAGPAYVRIDADAASSAYGLALDVAFEGPGSFEWDMRSVMALSKVSYRPDAKSVLSGYLAVGGGLTHRARSGRVRPWLGASLMAAALDTHPFGGGSSSNPRRTLLGVGPAVVAGIDLPAQGKLALRLSTVTTVLPRGLSNREMSGVSTAISLQLQPQ